MIRAFIVILTIWFCVVSQGPCDAFTREEAWQTVVEYASVSYSVNKWNVCPDCCCYVCSGPYRCAETVGLGSQQGMAYGWGRWDTISEFLSRLARIPPNHVGAGGHSCVDSWCIAGVECGGLVSRAWRLPTRHTTRDLPHEYHEIIPDQLELGDILNWYDEHVVMFKEWTYEELGIMTIGHSSASAGRVVIAYNQVLQDFLDSSYVAGRSKTLAPDIIISHAKVTPGERSNILTWTQDRGEGWYNIYRSDHCWGPCWAIASFHSGDPRYTSDGKHYTFTDTGVQYFRDYWYRINDTPIGYGTPQGLPQPSLPSTPTNLAAENVLSDCGNSVWLHWQASLSVDSYYVFRSSSLVPPVCPPGPEFLCTTTLTEYFDSTVGPDSLYSYSVIAANGTGSSGSSAPDSVIPVRELVEVSVMQSQVLISDDSLFICPGGDADSLDFLVTLVDTCGMPIQGEPPSEVYGILVGDSVKVCFGDSLTPTDSTDEMGRVRIVAHHIGGCGTAKLCVYARGQALAEQPLIVFRSPDLNADCVVNASDWSLWAVGGECTDLNWDGTCGGLVDSTIFNSHWQHTSSPTIVLNAPNGSEWWNAGDEREISWQFTPTGMTNAYGKVDLFLSVDGGATFTQPMDSLLANNGSYTWAIPQGLSSGECKVRAIARDVHGCSVSDASDGCFSVAAVKSGLVVADTTWASPVSVVGDVTVAEGAGLSLSPGAAVKFDTSDALHSGQDSTTCELIVMGGLRAQGSQAKPVELSSISSSPQAGDWRGIRLRPTSSSVSLDNCVIRHAYTGIEACTTAVTVDSCTISDFSNDGIKASGSTVTITGNSISLGSTGVRGIEFVNTSGSAGYNVITGSSQGSRYGAQCSGAGSVSLSHNEFANMYVGIKGYGTSQLEIADNLLTSNASQGVVAEGSCEMTLRRNRISDYGYYGVALKNSAYVNLGAEPDSGLNSIPKTAPVSSYCVLNKRTVTVMAEDNWWGTDAPLGSFFYGPVDWVPFLTEDPGLQFAVRMPGQVLTVPARAYTVQNYPNPMNPMTTIEYGVPEGGMLVTVKVYDVSGRLVRTLVEGSVPAGVHTVSWDGRSENGKYVASGVYLYEAVIGEYRVSKKMVVLK